MPATELRMQTVSAGGAGTDPESSVSPAELPVLPAAPSPVE